MHKASVEETLKLKRLHVDQWSIKEQLALASSVQRSGDQNWASVSRAIKPFGEKDRPNDWFSQKNCALQYEKLLENVETPKRRRGDKGEESKPVTPGELIVEKLRTQRLEELQGTMDLLKRQYRKAEQDIVDISSGKFDDNMERFDAEIDMEFKAEEEKKKKHEIWLKEREEKINEIQRAWRPITFLRKKANIMESSASSDAEVSQDSVLSENITTEQPAEEDPKRTTPTSPLLTHLLKSPASTSQPSILHSAIMSHRPAASSPTITSLLASSTPTKVFLPTLSNLVTSAVTGTSTEQLAAANASSAGAPTLSMLLELPPSVPGTPLPELPAPVESTEMPVQEVKTESPLVRHPGSVELLQSTVESSIEFEKQLQNFDKNAVDNSKCNVLEELPQDVVELIEEVEEAAEAKKQQQGELFLSSQISQNVQIQPKPEPQVELPKAVVEQVEPQQPQPVQEKEQQVPVETAKAETVEPEIPMEVDTPDNSAKEEQSAPVEEVVEVEEEKIVKESSPTKEEKAEPEPVAASKEEVVVEKEPVKVVPEVPKKAQEKEAIEEERESEIEESSDDDYKPRPVNIMTYPARTKRSMLRRSAPLQSTTDESMPNSPVSVDEDKNKSWKKAMLLIWDRISAHKNASLFLKPITNEQVPGYRDVILRPMDLLSIKKSIETGSISSAEAFQRDLQLVFLNAIMYNPSNHDVAAMALEMQKDSHDEFQVYAAVAHESRSYKRETREGSRRHEPLEEVVPTTFKFVTIISSSSDNEESSGNAT